MLSASFVNVMDDDSLLIQIKNVLIYGKYYSTGFGSNVTANDVVNVHFDAIEGQYSRYLAQRFAGSKINK